MNCEDLIDFNPQGPRGPRPEAIAPSAPGEQISIHKALAGLDSERYYERIMHRISIHKALAGLDGWISAHRSSPCSYFNPQGPRGPRLGGSNPSLAIQTISIHKALAGLDDGKK